jgi:hypothetical protein
MTICVASLCEKANSIVFASDRMITAGFLALEFEHPTSKIDILSDHCIGLTTGDVLANIELFRACKNFVQQIQSPSIELIANQIGEQFVILRRKRAEETLLKPRGITLNSFYQEGLISKLPSDLSMVIDRGIHQCEYPIELIITGVDNSGAHIYGIRDPGIVTCYDSLGYHAVGSGMSHALLSFVANEGNSDNDINMAVFLTYEAKRKAEVAQGVGEATDIGIINDKRIKMLSEEEKKKLDQIYNKKMKPQLKEIQEEISKLNFSEGG